jgi:hypothetical protein
MPAEHPLYSSVAEIEGLPVVSGSEVFKVTPVDLIVEVQYTCAACTSSLNSFIVAYHSSLL